MPPATRSRQQRPRARSPGPGESRGRLDSPGPFSVPECRRPPPAAGLCPSPSRWEKKKEKKKHEAPRLARAIAGESLPPGHLRSAAGHRDRLPLIFPRSAGSSLGPEKKDGAPPPPRPPRADFLVEPSGDGGSRGRPDATGRPRMARAGKKEAEAPPPRPRHHRALPGGGPGKAAAGSKPPGRLRAPGCRPPRPAAALCPLGGLRLKAGEKQRTRCRHLARPHPLALRSRRRPPRRAGLSQASLPRGLYQHSPSPSSGPRGDGGKPRRAPLRSPRPSSVRVPAAAAAAGLRSSPCPAGAEPSGGTATTPAERPTWPAEARALQPLASAALGGESPLPPIVRTGTSPPPASCKNGASAHRGGAPPPPPFTMT